MLKYYFYILLNKIECTLFHKLLHYIKSVKYLNSFGDETKFDENGDPAAMYDLVNWQLRQDGEMEFVTIGKFDEMTAGGKQELQIQEHMIVWNGNQTEVRISIEQNNVIIIISIASRVFLLFNCVLSFV